MTIANALVPRATAQTYNTAEVAALLVDRPLGLLWTELLRETHLTDKALRAVLNDKRFTKVDRRWRLARMEE